MGKRIQRVDIDKMATKLLELGYQEENIHTEVQIDCTGVLWDYPDATVEMSVQAPNGEKYPVVPELANNVVIWDVTDSDLVYPGSGKIQLTLKNGDEVIKSATCSTRIMESITATGSAPTPLENWMQQAEETAHQIALTAKDEVIEQIQDAAEEARESIPADYTQLSDDVTGLKSALFDTSTEYVDSTLWEVGGVARATGANSVATNRLRLSALQTVLQFDKIVIPDGYRLAVYGWAASGGAYLGLWKDGEGFQKTTSAYNTGEFDLNACKTAGAGKFRLMLFRADNADFSDATEAGLLIYKTETNNLIELDTRLTDTESNLHDILHQTTKSFIGTTKKLMKKFPIKLYNGRKYTFANNSGGTVNLKLVKDDGTERTISSSVADGNAINFICDSNEYIQISVYFNEIDGPVTLTSMDDGVFCETDIDNTDYNATSVSLFETIGAIGDSYTSGGIKPSSSSSSITNHYGISWPKILARKCGIDATNYSYTGASIKSFLTNTDGTWAIDKLEADEPRNLYIIVMGINSEPLMDDSGTAPIGSVSDINDSDYTQNGDTFCGHYGQMVQRIINHAPLAKIILVVPLMVQGTERQTAINEIAAHYGLPKFRMIDDSYYKTSFYTDNRQISHPIGITYAGMANAFERQIIKCIVENTEYFSNYLVP